VEKPSNSSRNNFGKITKKELVVTLKNIELLSFSVSLSFTSRHFPAFLKCYGEAGKYKFALNSIFTILALVRFVLSTVELVHSDVLFALFCTANWLDLEGLNMRYGHIGHRLL